MTPTTALITGATLLGALLSAAPAGAQTTVPFSDPARPGSVRVVNTNGNIVIKGANRRDVLIETRGGDSDDKDQVRRGNDRTAGMRRITQAASYSAVEENNQLTIAATAGGEDEEIVVTVPTRTNVNAIATNGDTVTIEGIEGTIEAHHVNGDITLRNVSGSVVANTTNGDIKATLTRLTPDKPMAFVSFNGDVDVTLPATVKATLKLRSDMGDVYVANEFDVKVSTQASTSGGTRTGGRVQIEVNKQLTGTLNGGGPEIELRTFSGDVYLRRGGQ